MTAVIFALTALENGRRLGHAVICTSGRYASVLSNGAPRIERRFVAARTWLALESVLSDTLDPGPVPADGPISAALLPEDRRRSTVVQYLYAMPVVEGPDAAQRLDELLTGLAAPQLRLRME